MTQTAPLLNRFVPMAVDNAPVTAPELEKAHDLIRSQVTTRWSSFRKAFRALDADASGKVDRTEALRILTSLHLTNVREKTLMKIMQFADANGDGLISYDE